MGFSIVKLGDFIGNIIKTINDNFSNVLSKDNTTAYTPTGDFNPATKKYVDDSVGAAGGGDMLKATYDSNTDGIVNQADKVTNKLTIKSGATTLAEFDGSAAKSVDVIPSSAKGSANGVASLDSNGQVQSSQLPSYVDDVLEGYYYNSQFYKESAHTTVIPAESGKIYVDIPSDITYRWTGTKYTEISKSYIPNAAEVLMTGYIKPGTASPVLPADNVNQAIGKLEKAVESIVPYAPTKTSFDASANWSATATEGVYTLTLTIANGKTALSVFRLNGSNVYDMVAVGISITNGTTLKITSYDKFAGYVILV